MWDEIGELMGAKIEVDLDALQVDGKGETHGLIDLKFWADFFDATRPMRIKDATTLAREAYSRPQAQSVIADLPYRASVCARRRAHLTTPEFLAYWEQRADHPPSARYREAKAEAEAMLTGLRAASEAKVPA